MFRISLMAHKSSSLKQILQTINNLKIAISAPLLAMYAVTANFPIVWIQQ